MPPLNKIGPSSHRAIEPSGEVTATAGCYIARSPDHPITQSPDLPITPAFRRFVAQRFPAQLPLLDNPTTRRRFCQLMGASLALAGLNGCDWPFWPGKKLVPEVKRPEGRSPGVPVYYATAFELGGAAEGLLVKSCEGRPIKVEGNPQHPVNQGGSSAFAQALILELYDPGRSQGLIRRRNGQESGATWDEFAVFLKDLRARIGNGKGLHILSEASSSLSVRGMRACLLMALPESTMKALPEAKWHEYEPLSRDNEREGTRLIFGRPCRPVYHLEKADTIVSLDEDLLGAHPSAITHTRDFAARRNADGKMNRLIVYESAWTITGAMADSRTGKKPSEMEAFVRSAALREALAGREHSLVAAGPRLSAQAHALVHLLNSELGNRGKAVTYVADLDPKRPGHGEAMSELTSAMEKDEVDTLLILGGNPVYDAPADLEFVQKLKKVPNSIHLSLYDDETSRACTWHLPRAHTLESWGDSRAWDGTISLQQPLVEPLYGGKTPAEVLAWVLDEPLFRGYEIAQRVFKEATQPPRSDEAWKKALHEGVVAESFSPWPQAGEQSTPPERSQLSPPAAPGLELLFVPDYRVYDGRFANNGWLQEMPDPITKLTWDNAAQISPETARAQGVGHGDMVKIELEGRALEIAVFVVPGIADGTVILPLGYGRRFGGQVADGVGFNTYVLRTTKALYTASGARMTRTGATYRFATAQDHKIVSAVASSAAAARTPELARSASLSTFKANPNFAQEMIEHPPPGQRSLFSPPHEYTGNRWGMAIDLSRCTGCSVCTVACQAENNVPVVGKDEVARGRRMQWLRVDRYFHSPHPLSGGERGTTALLFQPVPCMHCEKAPCEEVCPVGATSHSNEGLNDMAYNRCVGTRYCSNNCPYKVRRFNWFNNHLKTSEAEKLMFNPDVTVRSRGVMEKCTYCVQRIVQARIAAKLAKQDIKDGDIVPACAQACPARAIVFGDLNDPKSRVAEWAASPRAYGLLEQLNTRPRTRYLARVWNDASGLASTTDVPPVRAEHGRDAHAAGGGTGA